MDELEFEKPKVVFEGISQISDALKEAPKIEGLATGVEGLDDLFFTTEIINKKVVKKSLGGIPSFSVFNITGSSDTGKSLLVEQFAVKQAENGRNVIFVTAETPAAFVAVSLSERTRAMGIEFSEIENNIILIDAASYSLLRENIPNLLATLEYVIKKYSATITIIDSVTGFYENKEMLARTVIRRIYNFLKKHRQTALLVSQKDPVMKI